MILWFFGAFAISSLAIFGAFIRIAWKHRKPLSVYNAPLALAVALDLHAVAFAVAAGMRIADIMHGIELGSAVPPLLTASYAALLVAKIAFVWVASLGEGRTYDKRLWWGFWAAMALWTGIVCF